jgi:hypothetical protein
MDVDVVHSIPGSEDAEFVPLPCDTPQIRRSLIGFPENENS